MSKLRLIAREFDGFQRSFSQQAESFARETAGFELEIEFVEVHDLYERMVAGGGSKGDRFDLFLCVTDWLPELMAGGGLLPLDSFLREDAPEGWPDAWSPAVLGLQTDARGRVHGIPYHDGPEVLMYRTDLFGDPSERERFRARFGYELRPPETWSRFLDVARYFTRPDDGLWGTVVAAYPDAHNNVYDFLIHLWSRGGSLVTADWRPALDSDAGQEALGFYVDLLHEHKVMSPEVLEFDSVGSGLYYASGKAAMMWNWVGFDTLAQSAELSSIVAKNASALVPRGDGPAGRHTSLNVYWVLAVTAGSRNPDLAYRFIKHCATPEMDRLTSLAGGCGTRLSTWRDAEVQALYPCYEAIEPTHLHTRTPPPVAEGALVIEALNSMVDDAMNQRKSVRRALADAAAQIQDTFAEAGYYRPGGLPHMEGY